MNDTQIITVDLNHYDTEEETLNDVDNRSIYPDDSLFEDSEILKVHEVSSRVFLGNNGSLPVYADKNSLDQHIIQQLSKRGCSAGVSAMVILDHGKTPSIENMSRRNLGTDRDIMRDLNEVGLHPTLKRIGKEMEKLIECIETDGPTIVTIQCEIGGHCILVDEIHESYVRIRDPYHGWNINITRNAFEERWKGDSIIQIKKL